MTDTTVAPQDGGTPAQEWHPATADEARKFFTAALGVVARLNPQEYASQQIKEILLSTYGFILRKMLPPEVKAKPATPGEGKTGA